MERTHRHRLHEGTQRMFAPLRGGALPSPWRLDELDVEQGLTLRLCAEGVPPLVVEIEALDASRPAYARTARFNLYYSVVGASQGGLLSASARAALDAVVALLRAGESQLPEPPAPAEPTGRRLLVREVEVTRALVKEGEAAYYLNPYVGCLYACPFCYAAHRADLSRALDGAPAAPWGQWLDVKVNAAEVLAREVRTLTPGTVRLSPIVTDPYQPVERRYRITRACLEILGAAHFTPVVLTRSSLVLDDLDLLREMSPAPLVGFSVPTDDDAVRAAIEPETEPIEARLHALDLLKAAGLRTFAVIQPMLPQDSERLATLLAPLVEAVRIGPLYEKARIASRLTQLGAHDATSDAWAQTTFESLRATLEAQGVLVNPTTPPWSLLT